MSITVEGVGEVHLLTGQMMTPMRARMAPQSDVPFIHGELTQMTPNYGMYGRDETSRSSPTVGVSDGAG